MKNFDGKVDFLKPYLIAEIGVNHEGSLSRAKAMIDQAARAGAHGAKFQSYKADLIASKNSPAYWDLEKEACTSQHALFSKYDGFGPAEYKELAEHCRKVGVDFLCTPFDLDAVDMLDPLVPFFKVASADCTNIPLLRRVGSKGKAVVLSTGASDLDEVARAVQELRDAGSGEVLLLHCVLNYPTPKEKAQLHYIRTLEEAFPDLRIGYSDHVPPDTDGVLPALLLAALSGALVLEKHFTDDRSQKGNDHYHSMAEADLRSFVDTLQGYRTLWGSGRGKELTWESAARREARRSLVAARDIVQGELFTEENLIAKRPGHGLSPLLWDDIIGKRAACDMEQDTLLSWESVEGGAVGGES